MERTVQISQPHSDVTGTVRRHNSNANEAQSTDNNTTPNQLFIKKNLEALAASFNASTIKSLDSKEARIRLSDKTTDVYTDLSKGRITECTDDAFTNLTLKAFGDEPTDFPCDPSLKAESSDKRCDDGNKDKAEDEVKVKKCTKVSPTPESFFIERVCPVRKASPSHFGFSKLFRRKEIGVFSGEKIHMPSRAGDRLSVFTLQKRKSFPPKIDNESRNREVLNVFDHSAVEENVPETIQVEKDIPRKQPMSSQPKAIDVQLSAVDNRKSEDNHFKANEAATIRMQEQDERASNEIVNDTEKTRPTPTHLPGGDLTDSVTMLKANDEVLTGQAPELEQSRKTDTLEELPSGPGIWNSCAQAISSGILSTVSTRPANLITSLCYNPLFGESNKTILFQSNIILPQRYEYEKLPFSGILSNAKLYADSDRFYTPSVLSRQYQDFVVSTKIPLDTSLIKTQCHARYPIRYLQTPIGIAVIIVIDQYDLLPERKGAEQDLVNLRLFWLQRGFECHEFRNPTLDQMLGLISCYKEMDHTLYDVFAMCFSAHGYHGHIVDGQNRALNIFTQVINPMCNSSTLQGKPKLFFVQACQQSTGAVFNEIVDYESARHGAYGRGPISNTTGNQGNAMWRRRPYTDSDRLPTSGSFQRPHLRRTILPDASHVPGVVNLYTNDLSAQPDVLISFGSPDGITWRDEEYGSLHILSLCRNLDFHLSTADVESILRLRVGPEVEYMARSFGEEQTPAVISSLCKKLYLPLRFNVANVEFRRIRAGSFDGKVYF